MGYTMEGKNVVIWTTKEFIADDYPFNDDGENHTFFYQNLRGPHFATYLSRLSDSEKIQLVADKLALKVDKIVLRSRKSHFNKKKNAV
jgi:hypothetical protein